MSELLGRVKATATFSNGVISMAEGEEMEIYSDFSHPEMVEGLINDGLLEICDN